MKPATTSNTTQMGHFEGSSSSWETHVALTPCKKPHRMESSPPSALRAAVGLAAPITAPTNPHPKTKGAEILDALDTASHAS